ncbi:MAG: leucine-rich repeat domain-containing protein [Clostridia bacterium]|nr:leucine-rich repeat domain-containing protein [Clostridia bacterium]
MKKKIFLFIVILAVLTCLFAVVANAETPSKYIEFGAKFPGSDEYITVYTENAESSSNPRINFATKKFYSDVDFTNEVDMSTATGIDFSVTKTYVDRVQGNAVTRMTKPSSPLTNCVEVKWFLAGMPTVSYDGSFFQGWTSLKSFDFGNATAIADNTFQNCGFETITIPATITSFGGSAFRECQNLKSVKIEGVVTKFGNGNTFYNCPLLESVEISEGVTFIPESMFYKCSALKNVSLPTSITEIKGCRVMAQPTPPPTTQTRLTPSVWVGLPRGPTKS